MILTADGRPVGEITAHGVQRYAPSILRGNSIRKLTLRCRRRI